MTIQAEIELELRAIQGQLQLLLANIALALGGEDTQCGFTGTDAAGIQVDQGFLCAIEAGVEGEALHTVVALGQLRALQFQLALRRLERTGDFHPALELPLQLRP